MFFFTKSNISEQNIYRNRRFKIHFQRCWEGKAIKATQGKQRHAWKGKERQNTEDKTNSNSINSYVLKK
jgi:hypothetical protein